LIHFYKRYCPQSMENLRWLARLSKNLVLGSCVAYTFTHNVCDFWLLSEKSMEPTLLDGQIVLSLCVGSPLLNIEDIKRGDVVIARSPTSPTDIVCKRVVGLPGDRLDSWDTVPKGQAWLEGDNSSVSRDSRVYGPVPLGLLQGKVIARVWPLNFGQTTRLNNTPTEVE